MSKIKTFFKTHPVLPYFFFAFFISWGGSLVVLGPKFVRGETYQLTDSLLALLAMLAGPSLAGITLTAVIDGRVGIRELFSRMRRWRVKARWYAVALLTPPVLILAVLLLLSNLISPAFTPNFLALGIVYGLMAGFVEEIGWMGYAFPKMQVKHSALAASLILGVLHGTWHIVAGYLGASGNLGMYWLPNFIVMWIIGMTAMRVLIVWVYSHTGSVLLTQLMHASSTGFLVILSPSPISPANETLWYAVYAVVLWVVVAIVITRYGKRLMQRPLWAKAI
jgi:membrane protease YdiL (CAAX protease family)